MGPFITTKSGRVYHFLKPRLDSIDITDIAWALSLIPRFGGHVSPFYSVAQHSVLVSYLCPSLAALMHDAHEAYVGDVPSPLKSLCPSYQHIEAIAQDAVAEKFNLHFDPRVKDADHRALLAEARDFMGAPAWVQSELIHACGIGQLKAWDSEQAYGRFLIRFAELYRKEVKAA